MTARSVAVVDWSASNVPSPARPSADAIWIGVCTAAGESQSYHRTRAAAMDHLQMLTAQGNWLVGFDFPMGYPAGFAARLTGSRDPLAVWHWLAARLQDGPDNRNTRFQLAAEMNRKLGAPLFWGRPSGLDLPDLPPRKIADYPGSGLAERRAVEALVPSAQPVWKLFTTGSVGSQAITGLARLAPLTQAADVAVWPFDPRPARLVLAEIYPSLLAPLVTAAGGIKDQAQVRLLARALWRLQDAGRLQELMTGLPAAAQSEGWIIGAGHAALLQRAAA